MTSGIYVLFFTMKNTVRITIGRLGTLDFPAGTYCYVGSALNGIEARLARHFRQEKKLHWHIDYLLQHALISGAACAEVPLKNLSKRSSSEECLIAKHLAKSLAGIKGFGCSDCRCPSHLFYAEKAGILEAKAARVFLREHLQTKLYSPAFVQNTHFHE